MPEFAFSALLLAGLTALGVSIGIVAIFKPHRFLQVVICVIAIMNVQPFSTQRLSISLGSLSLYPMDVLVAIATLASLIRWLINNREPERFVSRLNLSVLTVFVLIGVLQWTSVYGFQTALRSQWSFLIQGVLLMRYVHAQRMWLTIRDFEVIVTLGSVLVTGFALVRIITHGLGSSEVYDELLQHATGRPTTAEGAFLVLVGFIVLLNPQRFALKDRPVLRNRLLLLFGSMVVLLQHRSVWVGALLALIPWIVLRLDSSTLKRSARFLLVASLTVSIFLFVRLFGTLNDAATNTKTLQWRTSRWQESVSIPRSFSEWLFGAVLGPTPASNLETFNVYSHSMYIDAMEKIGLIGLALLLILYAAAFARTRTTRHGLLSAMFLMAALGYGATYRTPSSAWLGLAFILWASENVARDEDVHLSRVEKELVAVD